MAEEPEDEFEVERIVDHVTVSGKKYYRVRWKNYTESGDTWEPYDHLLSCEDLLKAYIKAHNLPEGQGNTGKGGGSTPITATESEGVSEDSSEEWSKPAKKSNDTVKKKSAKTKKKQKTKKPAPEKPKPPKSNTTKEKSEAKPRDIESPQVKDSFWDDLEQGKINVFANDLYSKVKKRRKESEEAPPNQTATTKRKTPKPKHESKKLAPPSPDPLQQQEGEIVVLGEDFEIEVVDPSPVPSPSPVVIEEKPEVAVVVAKPKKEPTPSKPIEIKTEDNSKTERPPQDRGNSRSAFQMLLEESETGLKENDTSSGTAKKNTEKEKTSKTETVESSKSSSNKKSKPPKPKIQDVDFLKTTFDKQSFENKNKFLTKKLKNRNDDRGLYSKSDRRKTTTEDNSGSSSSIFDRLNEEASTSSTSSYKSYNKSSDKYAKAKPPPVQPLPPQIDMSEFKNKSGNLELTMASLREVEQHHQSPDAACRLENDISNAEFRIHIRNNNFDMINEALKSKRMLYNLEHTDSTWMTLLMIAASAGFTEIVRLLCHNGAKVNARSKNGQTALIYASEKGHELVVKILILYGAYVNLVTNNGETALMKAAKNGYGTIARHLLQYGADPFARSSHGSSAFDFAELKPCVPIAQLLQSHQNSMIRCAQGCIANYCNRLGIKLVSQPVIPLHACNLRESPFVQIQFSSTALGKIGPNNGLLLFSPHGLIGSALSLKCRMRGPCYVNAVTMNGFVMDPVMPDSITNDDNSKDEYNHFITNLVWKHGQNTIKMFLSQDGSTNEKVFITGYITSIADM